MNGGYCDMESVRLGMRRDAAVGYQPIRQLLDLIADRQQGQRVQYRESSACGIRISGSCLGKDEF